MINLQKRLTFASKGESFLEYRREQLSIQIKELWKKYIDIRLEFINSARVFLKLLNLTYEEMGKNKLTLISKLSKIQYNPSIDIQYDKKMGIVESRISYELFQEKKLPAYTFENTSQYLDDLIEAIKSSLKISLKFAEIEDLVIKTSFNFRKVNRRIKGLKNIIIPQLKENIKMIKEILEENERQNYIRLKKTKDLIINRKKNV